MSNEQNNPTPDTTNLPTPAAIKPSRGSRARLILGLANLFLQMIKWMYFLITGEWPNWPLW